MIGAIVGDINGSLYEFHDSNYVEGSPLWPSKAFPTDDSIITIAVAEAFNNLYPFELTKKNIISLKNELKRLFRNYVREYPGAGYGLMFYEWCLYKEEEPYYSYGNGAAMRVSPVGWIANSEKEVKILSKAVTEITHNHIESYKAAEATAMAIFMARKGKSKDEITQRMLKYYPEIVAIEYQDLVDNYEFDVTCQGTMPVALYAFINSTSFEDCLKKCLLFGGDCDTLSAIACSIAEAYYKPDESWREKAYSYLDNKLIKVLDTFDKKFIYRKESK